MPNDTPVACRTRAYRDGVVIAEGFPIADVSDHLADPACTVWFDLCSPSPAELAAISEELGLHELAVEDVLHDRQRPKLDVYDSHLFLAVYAVAPDPDGGLLDSTEIDIFVTRQALVTVRENDRFDIDAVVKSWDTNHNLARYGVGWLLHGLLDAVVDGQFELIQAFDGQVEEMEERLFDDKPLGREWQQQAFALRKNLVDLRRLALPMREVVNSLLRRDLHVVEPPLVPYYQDVYDHVLRVSEWADSLRDLLGNIRETHLTQQGYRLNTVMKRVSSIAAIIAVPTMVFGFYGQNVPYPGSQQPIGFWTSTVLTVVACTGLYWLFRKKDWL
ncbi:magnesium transporter CorA family protein [Nonomuraea endophytica]|uniref:Magnesium transporter n=1 Tax=Nonomuraea endophytica TaxID=714136 RepID=A0A7W8EL16_9ACTN|nr:magnesium transporter CorA family protein [Nonomuraea endophytica]MBB5084835.1 magnesium transporter [Nonomuraea endophytica]